MRERTSSKGMLKKYKYKEKITVQEIKIEISSRKTFIIQNSNINIHYTLIRHKTIRIWLV